MFDYMKPMLFYCCFEAISTRDLYSVGIWCILSIKIKGRKLKFKMHSKKQ